MKPAVLRIDVGCADRRNVLPHIVEAGLRQRPQILGALEADPRHQFIFVGAEARQHETGIAARGTCGKTACLHQRHRPAGARQFARDRQSREPATDDTDIDVEIVGQSRPLGRVDLGRGIPGIAVGRGCGVVTHQDRYPTAPPMNGFRFYGIWTRHTRGREDRFCPPPLDTCIPESEIIGMRRLLLLRHAKTERAEAGERDRDRKLTNRGRNDAPVIGTFMAKHGLVPDLALVSPAARAQETWR